MITYTEHHLRMTSFFSQVFDANRDQNTIVHNELEPPIFGQYIRILPKSWRSHISMRVELFGVRNGNVITVLHSK